MMSAYFHYHVARHFPGAALDILSFGHQPPHCLDDALTSDYIVFFDSRERLQADCLGEWTRLFRSPTPELSQTYRKLAEGDLPGDRTVQVLKRTRRVARRK